MLYWRYLVFIFCVLCLSDFFHEARVRPIIGKPVWVNLNKTMRCLTRSIVMEMFNLFVTYCTQKQRYT